MAKTRLSAMSRTALRNRIQEMCRPKKEWAVLVEVYEKLSPKVTKVVEKKYPPKDMAILKKYNKGYIDDCIKIRFHNGVVDVFDYNFQTGPYVADKTYNNVIYTTDDPEMYDLFITWKDNRAAYKEAKKERLRAYNQMLDQSRYVEDVLEFWPEAKEFIPNVQLPVVLTEEQIAIINADQAERQAA